MTGPAFPALPVVNIARQATAHNSGETVWEAVYDGADVVLRMSSWPRGQEAAKALREHGYTVTEEPSDGGHPRIRVSRTTERTRT